MSKFWDRTFGRMDLALLFKNFAVVAIFWYFMAKQFTGNDINDILGITVFTAFCLCYPIAAYGWDILVANAGGGTFLVFNVFTIIIWLMWEVVKFFTLFCFGPLIAIIVLLCLYFQK